MRLIVDCYCDDIGASMPFAHPGSSVGQFHSLGSQLATDRIRSSISLHPHEPSRQWNDDRKPYSYHTRKSHLLFI